MMIRSIDKIDDVKMEYSVQITFRLVVQCTDYRLVVQCTDSPMYVKVKYKTPPPPVPQDKNHKALGVI